MHCNGKYKQCQNKVEQFAYHLRQWEKHGRHIQCLDDTRGVDNGSDRLIGNVGKENPENKSAGRIKHVIVDIRLRFKYNDNNQQVEQGLKKAPKETND